MVYYTDLLIRSRSFEAIRQNPRKTAAGRPNTRPPPVELPRYDTIARAFLPRSGANSEDGTAPVEETMTTKTNNQPSNQTRLSQAIPPAYTEWIGEQVNAWL